MAKAQRTLFDPDEAKGPRPGPAVGRFDDEAARAAEGPVAMTVSALVARIKGALATAFPERVTVVGQLSNVSRPASGHLYLSLKDETATLSGVMWRGKAERLKFAPADGLEVVAEGRVSLYELQGRVQFAIDRLTPKGIGALELAFQQLREKLTAERLFDPARKQPIPRFPRGLGVVTSATGAAIRDIQRTLRRRWPAARVFLLPVRVQGESAASEIAEAVRLLDAHAAPLEIDTILVARGGGSLEDLWAFNEEIVARVVAAAHTPIISGVGHEVDVTICDLVADARAATPTAAAQLATPDGAELRRQVAALDEQLARRVGERAALARRAMEAVLRSGMFRDPTGRVRTEMQRVDGLSHRLAASHPLRLAERARARLREATERLRWTLGARSKAEGDRLAAMEGRLRAAHPRHRLALARQQTAALARQLESLSYRNVLRRGFSVTRGPDGAIRRSVKAFHAGERVETELSDGTVRSDVAE